MSDGVSMSSSGRPRAQGAVRRGAGSAYPDVLPADDENYEYRRLRIEPHVSRTAAAAMLAVRAEFTGWELMRSLLYADGSRQVVLRRRRTSWMMPGLAV